MDGWMDGCPVICIHFNMPRSTVTLYSARLTAFLPLQPKLQRRHYVFACPSRLLSVPFSVPCHRYFFHFAPLPVALYKHVYDYDYNYDYENTERISIKFAGCKRAL